MNKTTNILFTPKQTLSSYTLWGRFRPKAEIPLTSFQGKTLDRWKRMYLGLVLVIATTSTIILRPVNATQDVEEPTQIIRFIRLLLSEPLVAAELHRLVDDGCTWVDQVFWSGSPNEEALRTGVFWMTFSMKIATQSGKTYWKQFTFSRKTEPILEVIETTDPTAVLDCTV